MQSFTSNLTFYIVLISFCCLLSISVILFLICVSMKSINQQVQKVPSFQGFGYPRAREAVNPWFLPIQFLDLAFNRTVVIGVKARAGM